MEPNRNQESRSLTSKTTDTSRKKDRVNPFYVVLLGVGTLFVITCFGYFVMTLNQMDVSQIAASRENSFIRLMEKHGLTLLIVELVVLAICTFAAIGTDDYWTNSVDKRERFDANLPAHSVSQQNNPVDSPVTETNSFTSRDEAASDEARETEE